jgi:predicted YcjX-like family ATPase
VPLRRRHAATFLGRLDLEIAGEDNETTARELARLYTEYLFACRVDRGVLSTQPPGRFVMPGDLDASPALTFAPLRLKDAGSARTALARMMARRYEAYKATVVRPFFREHFARLDRQIVLVDALAALNAGSAAIADLEGALAAILSSFRLGRTNWLTGLVTRRIDRILFAATKADHLHHRDHDRLEAILRRVVKRATEAARFAGARVDVLAIASVRATREASVTRHGETLPAIIGTPIPGEDVGGKTFDGSTETAVFPGDLPDDTDAVFAGNGAVDVRFVRFRPPRLERTAEGLTLSLPHIRLDRALEFLFGDRLA